MQEDDTTQVLTPADKEKMLKEIEQQQEENEEQEEDWLTPGLLALDNSCCPGIRFDNHTLIHPYSRQLPFSVKPIDQSERLLTISLTARQRVVRSLSLIMKGGIRYTSFPKGRTQTPAFTNCSVIDFISTAWCSSITPIAPSTLTSLTWGKSIQCDNCASSTCSILFTRPCQFESSSSEQSFQWSISIVPPRMASRIYWSENIPIFAINRTFFPNLVISHIIPTKKTVYYWKICIWQIAVSRV